jgi:hypothetical protein
MDTKYLLVINYASRGLISAVRQLRTQPNFKNLGLLVITNKAKYMSADDVDLPLKVIKTNFQERLGAELEQYSDKIAGVICRGDRNIQYLRKVVPLLSGNVHSASEESLKISTDKQLMRQVFADNYPEISPKFIEVHSPAESEEIEKRVGLPVILKPANLASSLLIRACYSSAQLESSLKDMFAHIEEVYAGEGRTERPKIIAEQLLEGDFYSIDVYILNNELFYCPPVRYVPASQIGVDDFFLYKRFMPSGLSEEEIIQANAATKKAIKSVGLDYSSAHVELIRTSDGWKIIELGPRIGRFRHVMYQQAYGINHILNDVKIHLGLKPALNTELEKHCAAYSLYPYKEGILSKIEGLDYLKKQPEIMNLKISTQLGISCQFAKNGGHAVGEFIVVSKDKQRFDEITRFIDGKVRVVTK